MRCIKSDYQAPVIAKWKAEALIQRLEEAIGVTVHINHQQLYQVLKTLFPELYEDNATLADRIQRERSKPIQQKLESMPPAKPMPIARICKRRLCGRKIPKSKRTYAVYCSDACRVADCRQVSERRRASERLRL